MTGLHDQASEEAYVLIVDDEPTTRMLMREALTAAGFAVEEAVDGEQGVRAFERRPPDIVLLDVMMPRMDGFEACAKMRTLPGGHRVPVLMATSLEDMDSIHRAYEVGATDFITKPINWSLLGHRVRHVVRASRVYEQYQQSEARNRALLDAVPDLMFRLSREGRFLEIKASRETTLFDMRDPRGRRVREVLPTALVEDVMDAVDTTLGSRETQSIEFARPGENGMQYYEARFVVSGDDEVLAIVREITERRRMMEDLRRSEERFRSVIENASDLITIADEEGHVRYASPAVARVLQWPLEQLKGTPLEELAHPDDAALLRKVLALARAEHGVPHEGRIRLCDVDGAWHTMDTISTSMRDEHGGLAIVVNSRDVTQHLQAERALGETEEQLRQAQKMQAVGRLAGGVAHDFNNLLTAMLGYGQLLEERLASEGVEAEELTEVLKAADRATSLTRQLLTFSRRQASQPRVVDLNTVVDETRKMLQRLLGEDVELVTRPEPNLYRVKVDPSHIEQVIMNLAVNARDAMPDGGSMVIETQSLDFEEAARTVPGTMPPGEYVLLSVSDTGSGMDEETLAHIFEPFFTTKDKGKGTGLGLSTVYGIVEQSGGCIVPESTPGDGTRFRIYLPKVAEAPAVQEAGPASGPLPAGRETILLVEDEPWVLGLARRCLEKSGYRVLSASDGEEALHLPVKGEEIDMLVTDIVMPKVNGPQLASRLRDVFPELLVLYVSGYPDHAAAGEHRDDEDTAFIPKPFTLTVLAGKVREMLDGRQSVPA